MGGGPGKKGTEKEDWGEEEKVAGRKMGWFCGVYEGTKMKGKESGGESIHSETWRGAGRKNTGEKGRKARPFAGGSYEINGGRKIKPCQGGSNHVKPDTTSRKKIQKKTSGYLTG